jgi:putative peptidoglycan lipid II flippase
MHLLVSANSGSSRSAQIRVGAFLLLFVLPQLLLYAWGAVVTAMLHADRRFAAAAVAPVANNVVVSAAVGLFWLRGATGLGIGLSDRVLLGGGTLGGVLCMTIVPAVAAWRAGLAITPRLRGTTTTIGMRRDIAWASLVVIPAQLFLLVSLVVAGRVPGGVASCQIAFTLFLLPHALLGHPVATVLYPRIAASWAIDDALAARAHAARGLSTSLLLTAPAAALVAVLAPWIVRVLSVGELAHGGGPALVAAALSGYAVGLSAYSWSLLVTRVAYASGDVKTPGLAAIGGGIVGVVLLATVAGGASTATLRWIGLAHSAMALLTTGAIVVALVRRGVIAVDPRAWIVPCVGAVAAAVAARLLAEALGDGASRGAALGIGGVAAVVGVGAYAAVLTAGGIQPWRRTVDSA